MKDFIFNIQRFVDITNTESNKLIEGTDGADKINNSGSFVTINSGAGNDDIYSYRSDNNVIISNSGKNYVNANGKQITVLTGSGNDVISGLYADSFLSAGDGNDYCTFMSVQELEWSGSYYGGVGGGVEAFENANITVVGGKGDDTIDNPRYYQSVYNYEVTPFEYLGEECNDSNYYFVYTYGDGKDVITKFDVAKDTLAIDSSVGYNIVESEDDRSYSIIFDDDNSIVLKEVEGNIEDLKIVPQGSGENLTYSGGNQTITNYAGGEKINFHADFTGLDFNDTDFMLNSASGNLTIQNARDKVIDVAVNNNTVAYAYLANGGGNLDGSSFSQLEVIIGGNNSANTITAGSGGSSLWGGRGSQNYLYGGAGVDTFFFGKNDGSVYIGNASSSDVVNLYDISINDITSLDIGGSAIEIDFNTGAGFKILSSENLSATFNLADGSFKFNHSSNSWQSA